MRTNLIQRSAALAAFAFAAWAPQAYARCEHCGVVVDTREVKVQGETSGAGMVIGGIAGGVLGHQVGSGRGKDVATVAGAAGGAYAGNQVEKSNKTKTQYQVVVKMENGDNRTFTYSQPTSYRAGDKVKVVDRKLTRQ
jgi:uncharacterized protein YcfJ